MKICFSSETLLAWSNRSQAKEFITRCARANWPQTRSQKFFAAMIGTRRCANLARAYAQMYRGRLWINRLARAAVLRPQLGSLFVHAARIRPEIMKFLTGKIVERLSAGN